MTETDFRAGYVQELTRIAPDIEAEDIEDTDHIQDDLELDSMDILNLVTALHARFGVDIPEADYPQIATVELAVAYLSKRAA
ncbi:MAG: phosphopantetheine-binding protein [Dinoroseobacter sp.]|nr:phosphopantetheine-binding protein [Dinoroseobacter sp.]MDJ0992731.1 phosphopantetheine-binding protein [Dinoroseobacter sp.]